MSKKNNKKTTTTQIKVFKFEKLKVIFLDDYSHISKKLVTGLIMVLIKKLTGYRKLAVSDVPNSLRTNNETPNTGLIQSRTVYLPLTKMANRRITKIRRKNK